MRPQCVQMNENEMDVERLTSDRHEEQRLKVGSQQGGALQSGGSRMQKALSRSAVANRKND